MSEKIYKNAAERIKIGNWARLPDEHKQDYHHCFPIAPKLQAKLSTAVGKTHVSKEPTHKPSFDTTDKVWVIYLDDDTCDWKLLLVHGCAG